MNKHRKYVLVDSVTSEGSIKSTLRSSWEKTLRPLVLLVSLALTCSTHIAQGAQFLYWADHSVGVDQMQSGIQKAATAGGHTLTIATSDSDFANKLNTGDYSLAALMIQGSPASSYPNAINALSTHVGSGGKAIYADWSGESSLSSAFGATFTGSENQTVVNVSDSLLAANLPANPFTLTNSGWGIFSYGLLPVSGASVDATFANAEAAIVTGNQGRSIVVGFLGDTGFSDLLASNLVVKLIAPPVDLPVITTQPQSQTVFARGDALFSAEVVGASPLYFQWYRDGAKLKHATNLTLQLLNCGSAAAGAYTLVVANAFGAVTSAVANLTVSSDFSSLLPHVGTYNGLFSDTNGAEFKSSGFLTLKVKTNAAFSGKMFVGGNAVSISGKFGFNGKATKTVSRSRVGKSNLNVALDLNFGSVERFVNGTVSEGTNWTSSLLGHRMNWTGSEQATGFINSYTMIITNGNQGPVGSGYGLVSVNQLGKTKIAGHVADGHRLKQGTTISKTGYWPLFSPMYVESRTVNGKTIQETQGFMMGWLQFTNNNGVGNLAPVGEVHWIKTGWTNTTYTGGFSNTVEVTGSRWLNSGERAVEMTNAVLSFSAGDLGSPFNATYLVTENTTLAKITPEAPGDYPNDLRATWVSNRGGVVARTGQIRGTFVHPESSAVTKWFGAILQDQNYGEGFFMGTVNGGKVTFEAAE